MTKKITYVHIVVFRECLQALIGRNWFRYADWDDLLRDLNPSDVITVRAARVWYAHENLILQQDL